VQSRPEVAVSEARLQIYRCPQPQAAPASDASSSGQAPWQNVKVQMSVQVAVHRAREDSEIPYVNSSRPYDELKKIKDASIACLMRQHRLASVLVTNKPMLTAQSSTTWYQTVKVLLLHKRLGPGHVSKAAGSCRASPGYPGPDMLPVDTAQALVVVLCDLELWAPA